MVHLRQVGPSRSPCPGPSEPAPLSTLGDNSSETAAGGMPMAAATAVAFSTVCVTLSDSQDEGGDDGDEGFSGRPKRGGRGRYGCRGQGRQGDQRAVKQGFKGPQSIMNPRRSYACMSPMRHPGSMRHRHGPAPHVIPHVTEHRIYTYLKTGSSHPLPDIAHRYTTGISDGVCQTAASRFARDTSCLSPR